MPLHFLFPAQAIRTHLADEMFADQAAALVDAGFSVSLVSDDVISGSQPLSGIPVNSVVVYRGWMLNESEYARLETAIENSGAFVLTALRAYLSTHHLPNWYPRLEPHTPETKIIALEDDWKSAIKSLDWGSFFVKDFVKSLKTNQGSVIHHIDEIDQWITEMRRVRGEIEGGLCIRRVEEYIPQTERRFFVINGVAYSANAEAIPEIVVGTANIIPSRFFSVDTIQRKDGESRIVEIGDGQVSDITGWTADRFAQIWQLAIGKGS
ncbi:MAG: ATP-grasp domain-containing protein [Tepidisphaeraceae bacterium]